MKILDTLTNIWQKIDYPFLVHAQGELSFSEIINQKTIDLSEIRSGDVVALIGDFDPKSIMALLMLIEKNVIIVPLTKETSAQHKYFIETALVDVVVKSNSVKRLKQNTKHKLLEELRSKEHGGLVLFSTGTTGRPKAILHDLNLFMKRFATPRPTLKTLNFLLFDHIGGINTLLHTLFNKGTVVAPKSRKVVDILASCHRHEIEVLPTTPTFLRLMLMSGLVPKNVPKTLKIITYGTERMDQPTLDALCEFLPNVDFRQTYGMSELGIVRVKSKARNSLFMKVGGEGVETRVKNNVLEIRSKTRMLGYLNSESPFDSDGWYNTKDIVEKENGYYKITGRTSEVINVGGLKFMASEVERVALYFDHVELAKVIGKPNPITGQHVELTIQPVSGQNINKDEFKAFLSSKLPNHMMPKRLNISSVSVGSRFKKADYEFIFKKKNRYENFINGELVDLCIPNKLAIDEDGWAGWFNNTSKLQSTRHGIYPNNKDIQHKILNSLSDDQSRIVLLICEKENQKAIGVVSLQNINHQSRSAEIAINSSSKNKKTVHPFATLEAMSLLTQHGFDEIGLLRIYAGQVFPNLSSWNKMLELIGYRAEGILRDSFVRGQNILDTVTISCLFKNYIKIKNRRGTLWGSAKVIRKEMKKQPKKSYAEFLSSKLRELEDNYFSFLYEE